MQVARGALLKTTLLSVIRHDAPTFSESELPSTNEVDYRSMLGDMLISSDNNWKEETLRLIDEVWESEDDTKDFSTLDSLPHCRSYGGTNVSVWRGDITKLQGDQLAIVNAANEQGLGCYVPNHRCIDNVIHRRAGPRLRKECREVMKLRGSPLSAGTEPIVTHAYHLPSQHVIHVTGPQVGKRSVTERDNFLLSKAYELSLNAAVANGSVAVAFPCISTGLFGFPADKAARIALSSVKEWLDENPGQLDKVIFNVFTRNDHELYNEYIGDYFPGVPSPATDQTGDTPTRAISIQLARQWIDDADAVLICAGAGMSVKEGEMVYTNPRDFAAAYPWFLQWGYKTSYEVMGLEGDMRVPRNAKWALYAKHMDNMRWSFTPNNGYSSLLDLVKEKNHFVLTSNVDACFERAGFDSSRIYTPQGEWTYMQCTKPCFRDSVFSSRPYLDKILPQISADGTIPEELIPKCPRCGGDMFGNVRAGSSFLHHNYESQNSVLQNWMQSLVDSNSKVAILEVGAGFNTPTVTRFPVESFARQLGDRARLIRVNPTEPEVPEDLCAIALAEGWQVLGDIQQSKALLDGEVENAEALVRKNLLDSDLLVPDKQTTMYTRYFGHFDWKQFLDQLKDK